MQHFPSIVKDYISTTMEDRKLQCIRGVDGAHYRHVSGGLTYLSATYIFDYDATLLYRGNVLENMLCSFSVDDVYHFAAIF